jgi:hypothetical protein
MVGQVNPPGRVGDASKQAVAEKDKSTRHVSAYILCVAALLLAAGLRLWGIAELPPGLHHDEAFHLLQAQQIANGEALPVYITGNQGNEPLFAYLSAIAIRVLGPVSWAGRLVAACAGILTVALTIRAGNEMFPGHGVGAAAGLMLAGWYWPVAMSRWGSQPILSAAASAGAMAFLWRGFRTGSRWAYGLAGLCLAAGLWAYAVFRLFPVVVVAAVVAEWLARIAGRRQLAAGAVLTVLVAAVLFAPLGGFFLRNPLWFFNRYNQVTQVSGGPASMPTLLDNTRLELAGLVWPGAGDQDWRQNLAGRPALDVVQVGLVATGLVLLLRRRKLWPQGLTLLAWFAVGLAISVLTEFPPQSGRSVMATPGGALIMGVGLAGLWRWSGTRSERTAGLASGGRLNASAQGLLVAALALSIASTVGDYFVRWATNPALFGAYDTGLQWIGTQLRGAAPGARLIETPVDRFYPTFEYTLGREPFGRFESFNGRECFLAPAVTTTATDYAIITAEDSATLPALMAAFPNARQTASIRPAGASYAAVYEVPAGATAQVALLHGGGALYGGIIRLLGDDLGDAGPRAGTMLRVPLVWRLERPTSGDLRRFVHLIGPAKADGSTIYAQHDSAPCDNSVPTWQWTPGEIMVESVKVDLPVDMPAGSYRVFTGWYDSATRQRLSAVDASGKEVGDTVALETITVGARASQ